ncbi:glycoside hydrolase family 2 TIM barrel-domain containing protein [Fundicoccus sp. Sow4_H7]|uniref:glycoside hydrolase family 2 TIM barrel-domain containing protein n=1 Tax=Fundicoccus sp. Sow4_H7 TaxID=3438784 RepID=UPI003F8F30B5
MQIQQLVDWKFTLDSLSQAEWQKDFDDSTWDSVTVPHDWSVHQAFNKNSSSGTGYLPGGVGWYRCNFSLDENDFQFNKAIELVFEGIYKNAQIWINGYNQGIFHSGYSSIVINLNPIMKHALDNTFTIAVKVDNVKTADSRWYNGSGINRPVYIKKHEEVFIPTYGTTIQSHNIQKDSNDNLVSTIHIKQTFSSFNSHKSNFIITHKIFDQNSHLVLEQSNKHSFEKAIQSSKTIDFQYEIESAVLWSPDQPHLYKLETMIESDDMKASIYNDTFGVRSIHFDADNGFFLNGESLVLKGVCLHEDAGVLGTAVPKVVWLRRLEKLKAVGCNAIRMAHNPHDPSLYDLCDELGFLVIDECFDEWENPKNKWWQGHNVYPPKFEGYAEYFPFWHKHDLENMIKRNINRPSIIAWSIGNEIDYPNDPYVHPSFNLMVGNNDASKPEQERIYNPNRPNANRLVEIATNLTSIVKNIDKTRPVTLAAAFPELSSITGLLNTVDVIGYNYKEHLYDKDHQRFPTLPMLGSENSHGYQQWLDVVNREYISGQFLWTGIDYLGEAHGWPIHGSGPGLLTLAGFEKDEYYLRQSWWSNEPIIRIATSPITDTNHHIKGRRKWDYVSEQLIEIKVYSNLDDIQLFIDDERMEDLSFSNEHGYHYVQVPYKGDQVNAIGFRDNQEFNDSICSTAQAVAVQTNIWNPTYPLFSKINDELLNESERIYQIECQLVDRYQNQVEQDILLTVNVDNGLLLGLENGNLADNTEYTANYRSTYLGKLIVFVKATGESEPQININSTEIKPHTIKIKN